MRAYALFVVLAMPTGVSLAVERASISGTVTDASGSPVEHATVMVYYAGVKQGYSTFCPSCYADCGKRTLSDIDGKFLIANLNPELWFTLLVARDGYTPGFLERIDPRQTAAAKVALNLRAPVDNPSRAVRGRVIDSHGRPVRDAIVNPRGIAGEMNGTPFMMYGAVPGLDPLAVTNTNGEFELAHDQPTAKMVLAVEARGLAPKFFLDVPTGAARKTFTLTEGALVRGRLIQNSKPVAGAEVGLISQKRMNGSGYDEVRLGTQEDGSFAFTNVPTREEWYVYAKMESIARRGAAHYAEARTSNEGEELNIGDIVIGPGHRISGTVALSDGRKLPEGTRVFVTPECAFCKTKDGLGHFSLNDSQTVIAGPDGAFEFGGLTEGTYHVAASVKGYVLADGYSILRPSGIEDPLWERITRMQNAQMKQFDTVETRITDRDVNLKIVLDPRLPK
jgi:hypothetical protein